MTDQLAIRDAETARRALELAAEKCDGLMLIHSAVATALPKGESRDGDGIATNYSSS